MFRAEGRSYGDARKRSGYGHQKGGHHKVELGIDPGKIVLKCKVQEPLEVRNFSFNLSIFLVHAQIF